MQHGPHENNVRTHQELAVGMVSVRKIVDCVLVANLNFGALGILGEI
jgi:hypothetical protein